MIITITLILNLSNCTNEPPTQQINLQEQKLLPKIEKKNTNTFHDSTKIDTMRISDDNDNGNFVIIEPLAQSSCLKDVDYWLLEKYIPVPGKIIGIWAEDDTYWKNTYKIKVFHDTLGFNYIFTQSSYLNTVISYGYDRDHIMVGGMSCDDPVWIQTVRATMPVWAYYIDEQGQQHSCYVVDYWFYSLREFLNNNGGSNIKIITGETTPEDFDCYDKYVNTIMCSWYGYYIWPLTNDQRSRWTDFKNMWGAKFNMTWVSCRLDYDEFDDLIGHARNLGLDGVWLYQDDDVLASEETERNRINKFCLFAWKWGFLKRLERRWIYTYECINKNPCDCDPASLDEEWILVNKYPTWETRIIEY